MLTLMGLKNAQRRKSRTVIVIIAIMLATALYSGLDVMNNSAVSTTINVYTSYLGDFDIMITNTANPFFNATYTISKVIEISDVYSVAPRFLTAGGILTFGLPIKVAIVGLNLSMEEGIGRFTFIQGSPENLTGRNVFILKTFADTYGYKIGDELTVYTVNASNNLIELNLKVAAIVEQYGKLPSNIENALFIDLNYLQNQTGFNDKINLLLIKLNPINSGNVQGLISYITLKAREIQEALGFDYKVIPIKATILDTVSQQVQGFIAILQVFASLTLIMAIILVFTATIMNLNDRVREIGILRSMGASKFDILKIFVSENMFYGLFGGILGLVVGYLIFGYFAFKLFIPGELEKFATISLETNTILLSITLGVISSLLGGSYAIYSALKVTPAEAMAPQARRMKIIETMQKMLDPSSPIQSAFYVGVLTFLVSSFLLVFLPIIGFTGDILLIFSAIFSMILLSLLGVILLLISLTPKLIDKLRKISFLKDRFSMVLSSINFLRSKRRSLIGVFMISLTVASIINLGLTMEGQKYNVVSTIKVSQGADIVVYCNEPVPLKNISVLKQVTGIASFTPVTSSINVEVGDIVYWKRATVNIYGINATAYPNASYIREFNSDFNTTAFTVLGEENYTTIIPSGLADKLNVKVGDKIRFTLFTRTITLKIISVLDIAPGFKFTRFKQKAENVDIIVSLSTMKALVGNNLFAERILVRLKPNVDPQIIASNITKILGENFDVQVVPTQSLIQRNIEGINQFQSILSSILYFALIVAVLGHITMITASIYERLWEISMIRAIGATRNQIILTFQVETILLAVIGYIIGLISASTIYIMQTFANNLISEIPTPIVAPIQLLVNVFIAVTIPSSMIAYVMVTRFTRRNIAENIRKALEL